MYGIKSLRSFSFPSTSRITPWEVFFTSFNVLLEPKEVLKRQGQIDLKCRIEYPGSTIELDVPVRYSLEFPVVVQPTHIVSLFTIDQNDQDKREVKVCAKQELTAIVSVDCPGVEGFQWRIVERDPYAATLALRWPRQHLKRLTESISIRFKDDTIPAQTIPITIVDHHAVR